MFKKIDHIAIFAITTILGIFIASQFYTSKRYFSLTQPENNEIIALEVAKLTKGNADLRNEVQNLTNDLGIYRNSSISSRSAYEKYQNDLKKLALINGQGSVKGQGIIIRVNGKLSLPQMIDLVNAIKNIGSDAISVNGRRLVLNSPLDPFRDIEDYEIKILGNSKLLKSAIERKGGIVDQISNKEIKISVTESAETEVGPGEPVELHYAKVIKE